MLLNPRYGSDPVLVLDGDPAAIAEPAIRQRRRLVASLGHLTEEQWLHPSRCAGWSSRDVIAHLDGTNAFWELSAQSALAGQPTELLASFDPVATPAAMVDGHEADPTELLVAFSASTDRLAQLWASIDTEDWSCVAEAPPGHISLSAVTHHALWDSWIHERDVMLPLDIDVERQPDEIAMCLRYATALGPALAIGKGTRRGRFTLAASDPAVDITIDIDDTVRVSDGAAADVLALTGDAVALLEALSFRAPLDQRVPQEDAWMFSGLAEVFETDAW